MATATANDVAAAAHAAAAATSSSGEAGSLQLLHEFLQVQSARAALYGRFNQGFRDFLEHGQEATFARLMQEVTPSFNAASQQVIAIEAALKSGSVGRPDLAALLRRVQEGERQKLKLTLSWQALRAAHAAGQFSWQEAADRPRATSAARSSRQQAQQVQQQQALLALMQQVGLESSSGSQAGSDTRASAARDQGTPAGGGEQLVSIKPGFYAEQMQRAVEGAVAAEAGSSGDGSSSSAQQQQQQHACHHHHHHHGCSHGEEGGEPDPLEPTEAEYTAAVRECWQELDACVVSINEALQEVRDAMDEL